LDSRILTLIVEPPAGLSPAAWQVAGTMALMAIWWATEALPFAAILLWALFRLFSTLVVR
jgi:sodium-dependent dicarboxylate transporter 2/3/5